MIDATNIQSWIRDSECEQVVREGLLDKVTTKQRYEHWEGTNHVAIWARASQVERTFPEVSIHVWENKWKNNEYWILLPSVSGTFQALFCLYQFYSLTGSLLLLFSPEWLLFSQVSIQIPLLPRSLPWLSSLRHILLWLSLITPAFIFTKCDCLYVVLVRLLLRNRNIRRYI